MKSNLLITKFHRPALPSKQVQRPQLIQTLNHGLAEGKVLTLVSAPAGFGKTSCISEWVESLEMPAAWLSLDKSDNDPIRFFTYFLSALQRLNPLLGADLASALLAGELPPAEVITTRLINDLMEVNHQYMIVLDDFQVIQENTVLKIFESLLANPPSQLHIVLITREDPLLPLARLRANDRLSEIRAGDLRFTEIEATAFLNERMGLALSPADITALENRTEGWIVGLQLAGLSMRSHDNPSKFIATLSGSHRYILNYLTEEVLHQQSTHLQSFMLQTSILDRLNGSLCDAITGRGDSSTLLEQLYHANLFLIPLDDEQDWYRYHHLFTDLLRSRQNQLPKESILELHNRASRWFEQAGMPADAIEHALSAENYSFAGDLIEKHAMQILSLGYAKTLDGWMQALPETYQSQNRKANLAFAWMHLLRGSYEKIGSYLKTIESVIANYDPDTVPESENERLLMGEWYAFQSNYLNVMGKPDQSIAYAQRAFDLTPPDHYYLLSLAYLGMGGAYRLKNDYQQLVVFYQKAAQFSVLSGNILGEMLAVAAITLASIQYGRLRFAVDTATPVIERIQNSTHFPPPIMGTVYGSVGMVYFEWNQLEKAYPFFQKSRQLAALVGHNAGLVYSGIIMSRFYQASGDTAAAVQSINEATRLLQLGVPAWLRPEVALQQVCIYLAQDNLRAAQAVIEQVEASGSASAAPPHLLILLARLRLLFHQYKQNPAVQSEASSLADQIIAAAVQQGRTPIALQALLIRARLKAEPGSSQDVERALELAEPEGFRRAFLDEGQEAALVLMRLPQSSPHRAYADQLLQAYGDSGSKPDASHPANILIEPLSERELDVLRLMARGLTYEEIARELVITVNTVRFHIKHLYGKLNVNNRTRAIELARQLDLL
jgi:LuxR family transcriptional regulator, maltose regulon positive regulatory protein